MADPKEYGEGISSEDMTKLAASFKDAYASLKDQNQLRARIAALETELAAARQTAEVMTNSAIRAQEAEAAAKTVLRDAGNYIKHVGANATMRGQPHPQQWLVEAIDAAPAPAQEPVAWYSPLTRDIAFVISTDDPADWLPLYAAPLAVAEEGASGWQPIETAPKDGTYILVWCVHDNAKYAADPIKEGWVAPVVAKWIDHNGGGWTWYGLAGRFTNWMPLPKSPDMNMGEKT